MSHHIVSAVSAVDAVGAWEARLLRGSSHAALPRPRAVCDRVGGGRGVERRVGFWELGPVARGVGGGLGSLGRGVGSAGAVRGGPDEMSPRAGVVAGRGAGGERGVRAGLRLHGRAHGRPARHEPHDVLRRLAH